MSEHHHDRDEDTRAIHGLTHILADWLAESKMQFQWMVTHHHFATKTDIENLRSTILEALRSCSTQDQQLLDSVLDRAGRFTQKIEALARKTS